MSTPKSLSKMVIPHKFRRLKPFGYYAKEQEPITFLFEEFESIRICDYERLNQAEALTFVGVLRPTLTRIYESAR